MVQLPAPFSAISRAPLLFSHPSPIEAAERLPQRLSPADASKDESALPAPPFALWFKRDDCASGLAYGGNKARKLEYVISDALAQGADTLVTEGGLQSNHMRQTAAAAARYGLKTVLLPGDRNVSSRSEYFNLGNIQLTHLLGAKHVPPKGTEIEHPALHIENALQAIRDNGGSPYFIPSGASTHPFGGLGYARWAFELAEQEVSMNIVFDTVIMATASGSTLGGMVAGFALLKRQQNESNERKIQPRRLIGVMAVTTPKEEFARLVLRIARTTSEKIGVNPEEIQESDFELWDEFHAGKYGHLDERTQYCIKELAETEGILLDPVYTGKAFTGLVEMTRSGRLGPSSNVLFCHTGGQSSLSAYPELE